MKKRYIGVVLAAMMMAQPVLAQAAVNPSPNAGGHISSSKDDRGSGSSSSSSKPLDTSSGGPSMTGGAVGGVSVGVTVTDGNALAGAPAGAGLAGNVQTGGVAGGVGAADGVAGGGAGDSLSVGNTAVRFASNEEIKEGFTEKVAETIFTINSGTTPLYRAIGTPETVGYNPLIPVQTLVAEDVTTQTKKTDPVSVTLYVPNLIEGLNNVQILYYNNESKKWEFMAPATIDYATKQVAVTLNGNTAFTVVYKN